LEAVLKGEPGSVMSLDAVLLPLQSVQLSTATPLQKKQNGQSVLVLDKLAEELATT